ncbi:hypothetical protein ACX40Y_05920 [Sphingomonas sp. RS6]
MGIIAAGWIGMRVVLLLPGAEALPPVLDRVLPKPVAAAVATPSGYAPETPYRAARATGRPTPPARPVPVAAMPAGERRAASPLRVQMALLGLLQFGAVEPIARRAQSQSTPPIVWQPDRLLALPDRWSASAWVVARPGTGLGAVAGGGQIGGSQGGARIAYMVVPSARIAAFARVAAPLQGRGAEVSAGVEWQPTRAPVRLVAERRIGIDGTRDGTGVGAIAGVDARLPAGFRLEGYGQAGVIWRERAEPYVDGAVRMTRQVAAPGGTRLAIGAGAWGAAQRDAERLDVGPSATIGFALGKAQLRVAIDWRQRIAGSARPGSGLALSLGTDF